MTSRQTRALRGALAASVAVFVALFSHIAGGGAMPSWLGILAPWVLGVMVCTLLAGKKLSLGRLAVAVGLSQLMFHGLFSLASPQVTAGGHQQHGGPIALALPGAPAAAPSMSVAHLIAGLVTIVLLYLAERGVRGVLAVAAGLRGWLVRLRSIPAAVPLGTPVVLHVAGVEDAPRTTLLAPSIRRRGPPALLAF